MTDHTPENDNPQYGRTKYNPLKRGTTVQLNIPSYYGGYSAMNPETNQWQLGDAPQRQFNGRVGVVSDFSFAAPDSHPVYQVYIDGNELWLGFDQLIVLENL